MSPTIGRDRAVAGARSALAQILSAGSNLVLQYGLLITLPAAGFGSMVVGLSCYYVALALGRATVGDPLAAAGPDPDRSDGGWRSARDRLALIGLAAAGPVGLLATLGPGPRPELGLLAAALPLLVVHDGHRYRHWAVGRVDRVVVLDGVWLAVTLTAIAVATAAGPGPATSLLVVAAWVGGGLVSLAASRAYPPMGDERPAGPAGDGGAEPVATDDLARSQIVLAVDANGLPPVLAAVSGSVVAGGVRAVALPFAPMVSILGGIRVALLPILRRAVTAGHPRATIARVSLAYGGLAVVLAGLTLLGLALVPGSWLGSSGRLVRGWLGAGAVIAVGRMVSLPLSDGVALAASARSAARTRAVTSAAEWTLTVVGAIGFGLGGAIAGRAMAAVVTLLVWVLTVRSISARSRRLATIE